MKEYLYWQLTYLRDKNIPKILITFIDWIRYEFLILSVMKDQNEKR